MQERKLKADFIFDGQRLLKDTVLVLKTDGTVLDLVDADSLDGASVESFNGILSPGLVNAHCHLELSHLKAAIETGTGLPGFVSQVMRLRHFDKAEILAAIADAETEMWQSGIQAVGDICNTPDTLAQKQNSPIHYRNFIECLGFLPEQAKARFEYARQKVWAPLYAQNPATTLVPHAPYSVSGALLAKINEALKDIPNAHDRIITMHNQESAPENAFFQHGTGAFIDFYRQLGSDISFYRPTGKTSLQSVLPGMNAARIVLLVHNTFTSTADVEFACQQAARLGQSVFYVLCPGANLYIENRLPDINMLLETGVSIALGTDSLASNHQLSIAKEMGYLLNAYPQLGQEQLLSWATYNGARALGFEDKLGLLATGKKPGILLLSEGLDTVRRIA